MSTHFNFQRIIHDGPATYWLNDHSPAEAYLHLRYGPLDLSLCEPEDVRSLIAVLAEGLAEMLEVRARATEERAAEQARAGEAEDDAAVMLPRDVSGDLDAIPANRIGTATS